MRKKQENKNIEEGVERFSTMWSEFNIHCSHEQVHLLFLGIWALQNQGIGVKYERGELTVGDFCHLHLWFKMPNCHKQLLGSHWTEAMAGLDRTENDEYWKPTEEPEIEQQSFLTWSEIWC